MKPLFQIIFAILFLNILIKAQAVKCEYCKKEIKAEYIIVESKTFHADHFLCKKCNNPIKGNYTKENKENYLHEKCFVETAYKKCDVCGKPLKGQYIRDNHNNTYHTEHEKEFDRCDNCSRLICTKITNGGTVYKDGRNICGICVKEAINQPYLYKSYLEKVLSNLKSYKFSVAASQIKIEAVDRSGLKKAAGSSYSANTKGYCNTSIRTETLGSKTTKTVNHTIYVLNKIPAEYVESIIAHELMHVWLSENTNQKHSPQLEEGSCNFMSYLQMKSQNSYNAKIIVKNLLNDTSPVYGSGFKKVYNKFKDKYLVELLNYLKKYK